MESSKLGIDELAKTVYRTEQAQIVETTYGEFVLISKEDYQYFLNLHETREIEANPGLNKHLLKSFHQDKSDFVDEHEVWDV